MPIECKGNSLSSKTSVSMEKPQECVASEEYSALPETYSLPIPSVVTEVGSVFHKGKYVLFNRLQNAVRECNKRFSDCKELASESDHEVVELCDSLEEVLQYGLKEQQQQSQLNFVVSAANLFQNMQEIVTGSSSNKSCKNLSASTESNFWEFCKKFLTPHESDRFEKLNQVWTNLGKGRAFIRATLNEHSLHRYLLIWFSEYQILNSYYSHWSVLLDDNVAKSMPELIKSLDKVLFALSVDNAELNVAVNQTNAQQTVSKEEPIVNAPAPIKVQPKNGKSRVVERPILSMSSTDNLLEQLQSNSVSESNATTFEKIYAGIEEPPILDNILRDPIDTESELHKEHKSNYPELQSNSVSDYNVPNFEKAYSGVGEFPNIGDILTDPIEPELEFLKESISNFHVSRNTDFASGNDSTSSANSFIDGDTDTPSQSSKYLFNPENQCNNSEHLQLEEKMKEVNERCALLETRVAQLNLENRQLIRRLKKHFEDSGIDPSSSFADNFLITIPHTKLHNSNHTAGSFHLYEIHITMRQNLEHWAIWRRYSDFNKLHKSLLKTHPSVYSVEFPPKKRFGNMNLKFVEERRQQLQIYLLNLVEILPQVEACKSKDELQKVFPFLRER